MNPVLTLLYRSAAGLARYLEDHFSQGMMLLPHLDSSNELSRAQGVALRFLFPGGDETLKGEVFEVIPTLGVVVRLETPAALSALVEGCEPASLAESPLVSLVQSSDETRPPSETPQSAPESEDLDEMTAPPEEELEDLNELEEPSALPTRTRQSYAKGLLSWPIEKLQAEWSSLTVAEKARIAKYGSRPARGMILRLQDRALHHILLSNPQITAEEVAAMAAMPNLDPALLKRIVGCQEWASNASVARNLICNPKTTMPQVNRLINHLSNNELRNLTARGLVRSSVKRLIVKKMEQRAGRG